MIFIASDHGGFRLKGELIKWLKQKKMKVEDLGPKVLQQDDDYPDYGFRLGRKVVGAKKNLGILICRSGIGMSVVANKVKGIRAGLCHNVGQAIGARAHNHCNVLVLPADFIDEEKAIKIIKAFFAAEESQEERRLRRREKTEKYENRK